MAFAHMGKGEDRRRVRGAGYPGPGCPRTKMLPSVMLSPGDMLFFSNYTVLHNRTASLMMMISTSAVICCVCG